MTSPSTSFVEREHPQLYSALESIHETTRPVVEALGRIASFDGIVLFVRDTHYTDTAASVASINTKARGTGRFDFQNTNINGRRVDLTSSTVGDTFRTKISEYARSKMNPDQHIVWGAPVPGADEHAVFQFAFSPKFGTLPDSDTLITEWNKHKAAISDKTISFLDTSRSFASVSDELLLDVPTTPNAYVLNWDLTNSTSIAASNYPILRHYLTQAGTQFEDIVGNAGGSLLTTSGDGQSFQFELPPHEVDRNSLSSAGHHGDTVVLPTAHELFAAHSQMAKRYEPHIGPLRIGIELGCYERTSLGDSSPSLWSIAKDMEELPRTRNALSIGKAAQRAIDLYRLLEK